MSYDLVFRKNIQIPIYLQAADEAVLAERMPELTINPNEIELLEKDLVSNGFQMSNSDSSVISLNFCNIYIHLNSLILECGPKIFEDEMEKYDDLIRLILYQDFKVENVQNGLIFNRVSYPGIKEILKTQKGEVLLNNISEFSPAYLLEQYDRTKKINKIAAVVILILGLLICLLLYY